MRSTRDPRPRAADPTTRIGYSFDEATGSYAFEIDWQSGGIDLRGLFFALLELAWKAEGQAHKGQSALFEVDLSYLPPGPVNDVLADVLGAHARRRIGGAAAESILKPSTWREACKAVKRTCQAAAVRALAASPGRGDAHSIVKGCLRGSWLRRVCGWVMRPKPTPIRVPPPAHGPSTLSARARAAAAPAPVRPPLLQPKPTVSAPAAQLPMSAAPTAAGTGLMAAPPRMLAAAVATLVGSAAPADARPLPRVRMVRFALPPASPPASVASDPSLVSSARSDGPTAAQTLREHEAAGAEQQLRRAVPTLMAAPVKVAWQRAGKPVAVAQPAA